MTETNFVKAKYWYQILWVNPDVNPEEGYFSPSVGSIYGSNDIDDEDHYVFDRDKKDFILHYQAKLILKLKEFKTKEELAVLLDEVTSCEECEGRGKFGFETCPKCKGTGKRS